LRIFEGFKHTLRQLLIISSFAILLSVVGIHHAKAQLITDSESKLKTEKSGFKRSFSLFGGKKNKSGDNGASGQSNPSASPRYSSGSPFSSFTKRKSASPRVSEGRTSLFRSYQNKSPRYSTGQGLAGLKSNRSFTPKYSKGSPFASSRSNVNPKYSVGNNFSRRDTHVNPKYSVINPSSSRSNVSPRYSKGNTFSNRDLSINPRYSQGRPFTNKDLKISPRYSVGMPFTRKDVNITPRYSVGKPFSSKDKIVSPRYSSGSPFEGFDWSWIKPRYSTNKDRFEVDKHKRAKYVYSDHLADFKGFSRKKLKWADGLENILTSRSTKSFEGKTKLPRFDPQQQKDAMAYTGDFKQKWLKDRNMHPSANHHRANQDSERIRNSYRKLNILWARVKRNKQQPDAVTDKFTKPKFDRKEAEIWNE